MKRQFQIVFEMISNLFVSSDAKQTIHVSEIGFTISIPRSLRILSEKQLRARAKRFPKTDPLFSLDLIKNNTDCVRLLNAGNAERNFIAGIALPLKQRTPEQAKTEYDELIESQWQWFKKLNKNFSRVYVENKKKDEVISNIAFEKFEFVRRIPERSLFKMYHYHAFYKNYQIIFLAGFANENTGIKILESIEKSIFD
jgi:hypothetical protein